MKRKLPLQEQVDCQEQEVCRGGPEVKGELKHSGEESAPCWRCLRPTG